MPNAEGKKNSSFLTKNDKVVIGVYVTVAIVCTALFTVTLVLLIQLKDSFPTISGDNQLYSDINPTTPTGKRENPESQKRKDEKDLQEQINELRKKLARQETNAKAAVKRAEELEKRLEQAVNKSGEMESKMTRYARDANTAAQELRDLRTKQNWARERILAAEGFSKLSNGLLFKLFRNAVTYEVAERNCAQWDGRLVSTSIKDTITRGEIFEKIPRLSKHAWIGLKKFAQNGRWLWTDRYFYKKGELPGDIPLHSSSEDTAGSVYLEQILFQVSGSTYGNYYICEA